MGEALMADQQQVTCLKCSRMMPGDSIVFGPAGLSHIDCRRPRTLSAEERALLFTYCLDHPIGKCVACAGDFKLPEMASDALGGRTLLCPRCRRELTESVRAHLYSCAILPEEIRRRAQAMREAAQSLTKESRELRGTSDVLIREAEAALHALRETMRESLPNQGNA